jgi:hypothetical protein
MYVDGRSRTGRLATTQVILLCREILFGLGFGLQLK